MIATRPKAERENIESLLQSNSTFLDLAKLKQKATSPTGKIEFENVFDVDRLIQSMKAGKSLQDFMTRYSAQKIDVLSLEEMSNLVKLDSSLNNLDKA